MHSTSAQLPKPAFKSIDGLFFKMFAAYSFSSCPNQRRAHLTLQRLQREKLLSSTCHRSSRMTSLKEGLRFHGYGFLKFRGWWSKPTFMQSRAFHSSRCCLLALGTGSYCSLSDLARQTLKNLWFACLCLQLVLRPECRYWFESAVSSLESCFLWQWHPILRLSALRNHHIQDGWYHHFYAEHNLRRSSDCWEMTYFL